MKASSKRIVPQLHVSWIMRTIVCCLTVLPALFLGTVSAAPADLPETSPDQTEHQQTQETKQDSLNTKAIELLVESQKNLKAYNNLKVQMRMNILMLGKREYQAQGLYVQAEGDRIHQSMEITVVGADGEPLAARLLQVNNGQVLYTSQQVEDEIRVTRLDVTQVKQAILEHPVFGIDLMVTKLATGGLPTLLAQLQTSIDFKHIQSIEQQGVTLHVLEGTWNKIIRKLMLSGKGKKKDTLPEFIPDRLSLYLDANTLLPRRILFSREEKDKVRHLVAVDLFDYQELQTVDPGLFNFTPPEGTISQDITQNIIRNIEKTKSPQREPQEKTAERKQKE